MSSQGETVFFVFMEVDYTVQHLNDTNGINVKWIYKKHKSELLFFFTKKYVKRGDLGDCDQQV